MHLLRIQLLLLATSTLMAVGPANAQEAVSWDRGTLVVVNKRANTVNLIDLSTREIIATLPTGNGPHEVIASRDGRTAVVTDYGGGGAGGRTLTVVDVEGSRVARTIDLGQYTRLHGIQFLPGDSLVAVTSESTQNIVLVRPDDGAIVKVVATEHAGSHMVAITENGSLAFTGNMGDATVSQIDLRSGVVTRVFDVPAQPEAITVTPDGREVWVGSNAEGTVNVINTQSGQLVRALGGLSWPYRILITPDQQTVLIPDLRQNQLRFVDHRTRAEQFLLDIPGGPQGLTLSRDTRSIFLSLSQLDQIAVIDLATRNVVDRIATGPGPDGVAHSPIRVPR